MSSTHLGVWDYVTCTTIVLLASCIGVYHAFTRKKPENNTEFLVKNRDLGIAPLILSAAATFTSAIGFLAIPVETYNNGVSFMVHNITVFVVIFLGVFLYLPVFYNLEVSSIFQYLEVRFSRGVRQCASGLINLQMMLYTSCTIYAPALALNQVIGMHIWASIAFVGVICIIYASMGGIKAVVWADATQIVVMIGVLLLVLFKGTNDLGGISEVWRICSEGNRTQFFVFYDSPNTMYTFWTMLIGGTFHYTGQLVTNQMLIQRYLSTKTMRKAKISFIGSTMVTNFLFVCTSLGGIIMYARYHDCDPLISGQVTSRDQIMALFAMETLSFCAGLPGVFIAAILCATLSTLSSALNSLAAISMEDYIKPCFPELTDKTQLWLSKLMAAGYGIACISLVLLAQNIAGIMQMVFMFTGVTGGPVLALFTIGMALPWVNSWGAIFGFFSGILLNGWASIGAMITRPHKPAAPFSINGCSISTESLLYNQSQIIGDNTTFTSIMGTHKMAASDVFPLYTVSSLWYHSWAIGIGIVVSLIVSIVTGPRKVEEVDPKLLFPYIGTLCSFLQKKCQKLLGYDVGKTSYLQVSMMDTENISNPTQTNPDVKQRRILPDCSETEMHEIG